MATDRTECDANRLIIGRARQSEETVKRACIGLTWTSCRSETGLGFAMSPGVPTRILSWPGTLAGRSLGELAGRLDDWEPFAATIGLAAANAAINTADNRLMTGARTLTSEGPGNLAVFRHFRPRLIGRRVVVIGRYPGLDTVLEGLDVTVLERNPTGNDLPDTAAEHVLPQADWVFITAMSLINRSFERLAELSKNAVSVLMGPSMPWLPEWADFGIDFLAGVQLCDREKAEQIVLEGGGTRLFEEGVCYAVADIGEKRLAATREEIAVTFARRDSLKQDMTRWYADGQSKRYPHMAELEQVEARLSRLDTSFKRQWGARNEV